MATEAPPYYSIHCRHRVRDRDTNSVLGNIHARPRILLCTITNISLGLALTSHHFTVAEKLGKVSGNMADEDNDIFLHKAVDTSTSPSPCIPEKSS